MEMQVRVAYGNYYASHWERWQQKLQAGASQKAQGISVKSKESRRASFNNHVAYYLKATAKCCN